MNNNIEKQKAHLRQLRAAKLQELTPNQETIEPPYSLKQLEEEVILLSNKQLEEESVLRQKSDKEEEKNTVVVPMVPIQGGKFKKQLLRQAAAILLLISGTWWGFQEYRRTNSTPEYERLATTYLEDVPEYSSKKLGSALPFEENEVLAKTAFSEKKYDTAASFFTILLTSDKVKPEHHFFLAVSLMQQQAHDFPEAIEQLLKTRQKSADWEFNKVTWLLGLAYIKTHKLELARAELAKIEGIYKTNEVRQLLNKMPIPH